MKPSARHLLAFVGSCLPVVHTVGCEAQDRSDLAARDAPTSGSKAIGFGAPSSEDTQSTDSPPALTGGSPSNSAPDGSAPSGATSAGSAPNPPGPLPSVSTPSPGASSTPAPDASTADAAAPPAEDLSAELFDPTRLPRFEIELAADAIAALNSVLDADDPSQDIYVRADLRYGSEAVTNVGLRLKGEGSFQHLDQKPALKLKFDEFVEGQTFHGLKRLTLNNAFEDGSFVAERLAYEVYRAAGVPAPRCNNALVTINGEFYGVYVNVEAEDKPFLRRWFANDEGNLYEEGQSDFLPGAENSFNLETNEAANDRTDLIQLIAAVEGANDPDTFLEDVGTYLDTQNYLTFTAVEAAVNQWDMYSYTVFWVNNLRLYNDPETGKFHFIPWGHDLSMKPFRDSGKPFVRAFELARQYDDPRGEITSGLLLRRCLESAPCLAAYRAALTDVITRYEGLDLEQRAQAYHEQIQPFVYEDSRKNVCCGTPAALSNEQFEAAFQSVLTTIRGRAAALREDLNANP
jgi:spore coat protein CotH